ncbi:MAG TPA: hypothetical protein VKA84_29845 [Gemmatimonadaceae bacterium]|nr:hypothetical protein [Gemmatimonadaceae bacterium]
MPPLTNHAALPPDALAAVRAEVAPHATLERVLAWTRSAAASDVEEIVTQDEYTHDVVVRYRDGLYLVYDTT